MMTSAVGVGVSGVATSALQAAFKDTRAARVEHISDCNKRLCCTILLYSIIRIKVYLVGNIFI